MRPNAQLFLTQERAKAAIDASYEMQQSIYVILRDYEQELCFVLMFWALAILSYKGYRIYLQQRQLELDLGRPARRGNSNGRDSAPDLGPDPQAA